MEGERTSLEQSILATLAYFDVFSYPLKVEEIWRWLYAIEHGQNLDAIKPVDVERAVRVLESSGRVERVGAFVVLAGRSEIVVTRMQRKIASDRMWRRARFASSMLRFIPFIRFVGVVNTLALDNAKPESDIDLFIIVEQGRLWFTRGLVTTIMHLLGIRRHGKRIANRVCLSFFMTNHNLSLQQMQIDNKDPYLAFWITSVVPMFDRSETWQSFIRNNTWVSTQLPHGQSVVLAPYYADTLFHGIARSAGEFLLTGMVGDGAEFLARFVQTMKMRFPSSDIIRGESGVLISREILKFHERDRRREYRDAFLARYAEVKT